jgi:hypothetical protein
MTMTLVETKTLASAVASIEFTSIPQDGTDLLVLCSLRGSTSGSVVINLTLNTLTTGFTSQILTGSGSAVVGATGTRAIGTSNDSGTTANTFNNISIYFPNYTNSSNKTYFSESVTENNATAATQDYITGLWSNTAAITGLTVVIATGNLSIGSTISLYKITKGSDGIVTTSP